jgi:Protein of unknown function (DUF4242)
MCLRAIIEHSYAFGAVAAMPSWRGVAAGASQFEIAGARHCDYPPTVAEDSMEAAMALRKFIIERDIPKVGTFARDQLRGAAAKSNEVLRQLGPDIQWVDSYVADEKTFCVYLAKDEAIIRQHAEISGFPASKITEIRKMIDPTTERAD